MEQGDSYCQHNHLISALIVDHNNVTKPNKLTASGDDKYNG